MAVTKNIAIIVERKRADGSTEYGVQYPNGHVSWQPSLPRALARLSKTQFGKRKKGI